ncbi:MAG: 23S rRNA (guanosine(2251)-2'-O)-methyltransferase RlmB [Desulfobacterales bacterium]|nr:23S rRNA (guanosine(2251)-2'-O)-methyltransferase RlmB [Desulfobacterales bacterium]
MKKNKTEILSGIHPVFEALKANRRKFYKLFLKKSFKKPNLKRSEFDEIFKIIENINCGIQYVEQSYLDKLTNDAKHQGVAAEVSLYPVQTGNDFFQKYKKLEKPPFVLILENLEDPHNFGALIRTALCAGVDFIMIPKDRSVAPVPSVSRSSAGAMEHAQIFLITNIASTIRELKENGAWVAGLDASGDTELYKADFSGFFALVVGGEHKGIRPLVKKECDFLISIPIKGKINSLNASVAGGIALYEALRKRDLQSNGEK